MRMTRSSATTASSTDVITAALLDTSVVIDADGLDLEGLHDIAPVISAITIGELAFGADLGADPDGRRARLQRILDQYEVLPYGVEEAKLYGALATLVRAAGRNPRPRRLDLQIAATAAAARMPLLTSNPDDFVGVGALVAVVPVKRSG
jgi:predicted nucleic acid-binding protein